MLLRKFERKEVITQIGEVENYFNVIVSGLVRKYYLDGSKEKNTQISIEGQFIHSEESFYSRGLSDYCIETIEPATLISITHEDFIKITTDSHKIANMVRTAMTQMYIVKDKWQMKTVRQDAKERFLDFVSKNPSLYQRVPQKHLASLLGIKPETFSRFKHLVKGNLK